MKQIFLFIVLLCMSFVAEAKSFKWDDVRKIEIGMTKEQVIKLVGKPSNVVSANGKVQYSWLKYNWVTSKASIVWIDFVDGKVAAVPDVPAEFK